MFSFVANNTDPLLPTVQKSALISSRVFFTLLPAMPKINPHWGSQQRKMIDVVAYTTDK
jgi:hypothetical protein